MQKLLRSILPIVMPLLSSVSYAQDNFDLPIKIKCNNDWHVANGVFLCNEASGITDNIMKIKIPPTRGSFRVVNCNRDLTDDGNPDDFDTQIWREGWWIFSRVVRQYAETPQIIIPKDEMRKNDCPIVVTLLGEKAGAHSAVIFNGEDQRLADFVEYSCAGSPYQTTGFHSNPIRQYQSGQGMGACKGLVNAELKLRYKPTVASVVTIAGTKCGIFEKREIVANQQFETTYQIKKGVCPITVDLQNLTANKRAIIFTVGESRDLFKIDTPFLVVEGARRRATFPIGGTLLTVEIYEQEKILWRSGVKESSFDFDVSSYDQSGKTKVCLTAWSDGDNTMSGACYDMKGKQMPYDFN